MSKVLSNASAIVMDVVGLAFTAAAIYVGVRSGVTSGAFPVFLGLSAFYLGVKVPGVASEIVSSSSPPAIPSVVNPQQKNN